MAIGRPSSGKRVPILIRVPPELSAQLDAHGGSRGRNDLIVDILSDGIEALARRAERPAPSVVAAAPVVAIAPPQVARVQPPAVKPALPAGLGMMRGSALLPTASVVAPAALPSRPVFDASLDDDDEPELWTIEQIRDASRLARKIGWRGSPEELLHETDGDLRGIGQGDFDPTPEQQALNARLAAKMRGRK